MEIDLRIRSMSLPVTVEYEVHEGDWSVGIGHDVEWEITHVGKRKCRKPPTWLYRRLTDEDIQLLEESCLTDAAAEAVQRRIDRYEEDRLFNAADFEARR